MPDSRFAEANAVQPWPVRSPSRMTVSSCRLLDCVVLGFIQPGDAVHAPDENYDTERLRKGARSWVRIFDEIARMGGEQPDT